MHVSIHWQRQLAMRLPTPEKEEEEEEKEEKEEEKPKVDGNDVVDNVVTYMSACDRCASVMSPVDFLSGW